MRRTDVDRMHLVAIAWLYVVLMMAVAEGTSRSGSGLGAVFTFLLYGVLPLAMVVYLLRHAGAAARAARGARPRAGRSRRGRARWRRPCGR